MKKLVLIAACFGFSTAVWAQKSQVKIATSIIATQGAKDLQKARTAIESAVNDKSTKNEPNTWYVRGVVYLLLQEEPGSTGKGYYEEADKSFRKAIALDPSYQREGVTQNLLAVMENTYNDGITAFNASNHEVAYRKFGDVIGLANIEEGKRFEKNKAVDTIKRSALLYQGLSAYYGRDYANALPILLQVKNDALVRQPNVYHAISDIYIANKDNASQLPIIKEALQHYPDDAMLKKREVNYYLQSGNSMEGITKLEDAIKAEPGNGDLYYNLGLTYALMANPVDAAGKSTAKPANFEELFGKAETAYTKAVSLKPENVDAQYNTGVLYFNRAVMVNDQMNLLADKTGAADIKKYNDLQKQRNSWFNKSLPFLEKTIALYEPRLSSLGGDDKQSYMAAVTTARLIYAKLGMEEKQKEMKAKQEALK
ncbi:MAG: tetratricopeptide repeat protein [Sphingobacteriales bacterium]|nr:MAG: tetratricopeptide repeat protein [Sphingobacteriales bacterium]